MLPGVSPTALAAARGILAAISDSVCHAESPTSVTASATFAGAGTFSGSSSGGSASNTAYTWKTSGEASDFEFYAQVISGALTSGTVNTWISAASNPSWSVFRASNGTSTAILSVYLRDAVSGDALGSCQVTIIATNINV